LHWYDFICPFCYVSQGRTAILVRHGFNVVELPFQVHADIPIGGVAIGPRSGPTYAILEREAEEAGLHFNWPRHLPNTRVALAAAEWVRRNRPRAFPPHADDVGIDLATMNVALANGTAVAAVKEAEALGRNHGVQGTPAWVVAGQLVAGLPSATEFLSIAERAEQFQ
jgi:predicted DsbA family dithiol-disulfide isomerase